MMELLSNPVVVALAAGLPSVLLAIFGYRQSVRLDKRAEATGAADFSLGAISKVIDGLNLHIDSLQAELARCENNNDRLRQQIASQRQ